MALSEKMKLKIHYAKRLAALPRDPSRQLTDWQRAADMRARAELEVARFELEEEAISKCVTDLDSAVELDVLEEIARLDPDAAEWLSIELLQDWNDNKFMATAKEYYDSLIGEDEESVPEETRQAREKERTDAPSPELKGLAKGSGLPSTPNQSDPLGVSGPRKNPLFSFRTPSPSEVYGVRDGRLLALAVKLHSQGEIYVHGHAQYPWYVYLATGINETLFRRGQCRRIKASTINDVKNICMLEGLELRFLKPEDIKIPDRSIFDEDPDRAPQSQADRLPTSQGKWTLMNRSGVHMNEKQKTVLIIVAVTVLAMLIFPPFYAKLPGGEVFNLGYALIVNPPSPFGPGPEGFRDDFEAIKWVHVNVGVLLTQWLGVLIAGGIGFFVLKD